MRLPDPLRSFTFRLALIYMVLFSASVGLLLGLIYWSTVAYMTRQTDATIEAEIAGLAEQYRSDGLSALTQRIAERIARRPGGTDVYLLVDPAGEPIVGNLDRWPTAATPAAGWLEFTLQDSGVAPGIVHPARAKPFVLRGGYRLLVGSDLSSLQSMRALIARTLWWGLALTVALALGGGYLVSRTTSRRLEAINATSREIMSGRLSSRIPSRGGGDEFDKLTANLNRMLDRIEELMEEVRRVSDNIAHDLRTPLTRLRTRLESLRDQQRGDAVNAAPIEQAIADADGLLATFNALLRIARIESEVHRSDFQRIDLAALIRDVSEFYEPLADEKRLTLRCDLAPDAALDADRDLLAQALANVLDNAVKYTPRGGNVTVRLAAVGDAWELSVADSGPGVPVAAREQVLRRFFRLEQSRSQPGNGLGLSLVAAVMRLHRAPLVLEDNAPGLRVVMRFAKPARALAQAVEQIPEQCQSQQRHEEVGGRRQGGEVAARYLGRGERAQQPAKLHDGQQGDENAQRDEPRSHPERDVTVQVLGGCRREHVHEQSEPLDDEAESHQRQARAVPGQQRAFGRE